MKVNIQSNSSKFTYKALTVDKARQAILQEVQPIEIQETGLRTRDILQSSSKQFQ